MEICDSCGGSYVKNNSSTHPYMHSSESCWFAYCQVLEKEYSNRKYWKNHRLTVDAYAVQHPGIECAQATQSVAIHLISLFLVLEKKIPQNQVTKLLARATEKKFSWLVPPDNFGEITVENVLLANSHNEHIELVERWARSSWHAWNIHHETIRNWAKRVYT